MLAQILCKFLRNSNSLQGDFLVLYTLRNQKFVEFTCYNSLKYKSLSHTFASGAIRGSCITRIARALEATNSIDTYWVRHGGALSTQRAFVYIDAHIAGESGWAIASIARDLVDTLCWSGRKECLRIAVVSVRYAFVRI